MLATAATVMVGIFCVTGWVGFKMIAPAPETASAGHEPVATAIGRNGRPPRTATVTPEHPATEPDPTDAAAVDERNDERPSGTSGVDNTTHSRTATGREFAKPDHGDIPADDAREEPTVAAVDKPEPKAPTTLPGPGAPTTQPASNSAPAGKASPPPKRSPKAEDYPTGLNLAGVMYSRTSRRAIICGKIVYEGKKINGAKVVRIFPDSVEVEAGGFRFLLGTGPKPIWLKTTPVPVPKDEDTGGGSRDANSRQ